jgi:hypothetical protein
MLFPTPITSTLDSTADPPDAVLDASQEGGAATPFVVEHFRLDVQAGGHFTPGARLVVTPALRTGGLLQALPDRETKTLLCLLTFLTANGRLRPTVQEVAPALGVGEEEAGERLRQLAARRWQGEEVARLLLRENGTGYAILSRRVLSEKPAPEADATPEGAAAYRTAGRDAVIGYSREKYARSRSDVEREIQEQLGHGSGKEMVDTPEGNARRRLQALGVPPEQADLLFEAHSVEEITNQLDWLPLRGAKNPARFVVASIQGRYDPPARIRLERAIAADRAAEAEKTKETIGPTSPLGTSAAAVEPVQREATSDVNLALPETLEIPEGGSAADNFPPATLPAEGQGGVDVSGNV